MVYEYKLYDKNLNYLVTVYMTEEEFLAYVKGNKDYYAYKKYEAPDNFQKCVCNGKK